MVLLLPPHQPEDQQGGSKSFKQRPTSQKLPLLPYEIALCRHLGITTQEYQWFKEESRLKMLRYNQHPPAVVAGGVVTAVVVSLVVGAIFTAVGAALMPKPRQPKTQKQKQIQQKNVAGLQGQSRYNQSYGFESVADIATYGDVIPYLHGRYRNEDDYSIVQFPLTIWSNSEFEERDLESNEWPKTSGGLVLNGQLVWSKVMSFGGQQALKTMFIMGCDTLPNEPDLEGIWIGNNTLDGLSKDQYAFYWQSKADATKRLKNNDLIYGTRGSRDRGDPESSGSGGEVIVCATANGSKKAGFSMAYTPTSQTTFGVYAPISNGQDRRVNWRVISVPEQLEGRARETPQEERMKVAYDEDTMWGVGTGYERFMGLIEWNGDSGDRERFAKSCKVGQTGKFLISRYNYDNRWKYDVEVDDIKNASVEERQAADAAMQVSEVFMCGANVLKVIARDQDKWIPPKIKGVEAACKIKDIDQVDVKVTLECIETRRDRRIGVVPERMLTLKADVDNDNAKYLNSGRKLTPESHVPTEWFGLVKAQFGVIRNQRPCEVTEIGIRSNVWGQFNGLCNFNEVPLPEDLEDADEDDVNLTVGNMNIYFMRYSFFGLFIRRAWDTENSKKKDSFNNEGNWVDTGLTFGIGGSKPVDQYNWIRITHPEKDSYEYRFFPLPGAYIWNNESLLNNKVRIIDAGMQGNVNSESIVITPLGGTFVIEWPGDKMNACGIAQSPLMLGKNTPDCKEESDKKDNDSDPDKNSGKAKCAKECENKAPGNRREPFKRDLGICDFGVETTRYQMARDEGNLFYEDGVSVEFDKNIGSKDKYVVTGWWKGDKVLDTVVNKGDWDTSNRKGRNRDGSTTLGGWKWWCEYKGVPFLFRAGDGRAGLGASNADGSDATYGEDGLYEIQKLRGSYKGMEYHEDCGSFSGDNKTDKDDRAARFGTGTTIYDPNLEQDISEAELQAEIAGILNSGCKSCGDTFTSDEDRTYAQALLPSDANDWSETPQATDEWDNDDEVHEFPTEGMKESMDWIEDNDYAGHDFDSDDLDVFISVVTPEGKIRQASWLPKLPLQGPPPPPGIDGRFRPELYYQNGCDYSKGERRFFWENVPKQGAGAYVLRKGDSVRIQCKTSGCKAVHLNYEFWTYRWQRHVITPTSGLPAACYRNPKSCSDIWSRPKGGVSPGKRNPRSHVKGNPLVYTAAGTYYRTDGKCVTEDGFVRATCKGADYQSGFILSRSFQMVFLPQASPTTPVDPGKPPEPGKPPLPGCTRCNAFWSKNPTQGQLGSTQDLQITIQGMKDVTEVKWFINGAQVKKESIGFKNTTCAANGTSKYTLNNNKKENRNIKVTWKQKTTAGHTCQGELNLVHFVRDDSDPCKDVNCPEGTVCSNGKCVEIYVPPPPDPVIFPTPAPSKRKYNNKLMTSCCDYNCRWNNWEVATQIIEHSYYDGLITRSSDGGPEHEIVYVNESQSVDPKPNYSKCTTVGLALKANRQITALDSLRMWVKNGRKVDRLVNSKGDTGGLSDNWEFTTNPKESDNFADLVWYLLTGQILGLGKLVKESMVDGRQMRRTARFLQKYGLLFNGVIDSKVNVREYIAELAPYFLCHFTIRNGLFTLIPVFPTTDDGEVLEQAPLAATFDDYNIIEGSLKANYLDADERQLFHAEMKYRVNPKNTLPEERTVFIKFKNSSDYDNKPAEVFDMTDFCTTREHAVLAGRYFMSLRKNITHGITFQTLPDEMRGIGPGDWIRVRTNAAPDEKLDIGSVNPAGVVTLVDKDITDGDYKINWWTKDNDEVQTEDIKIRGGKVVGAPHLHGALISVFTTFNDLPAGETYMIEQVELEDDGIVTVTASNWPEYGVETSTTSVARDILGRKVPTARLTGDAVKPGDSVMTNEVFGKPAPKIESKGLCTLTNAVRPGFAQDGYLNQGIWENPYNKKYGLTGTFASSGYDRFQYLFSNFYENNVARLVDLNGNAVYWNEIGPGSDYDLYWVREDSLDTFDNGYDTTSYPSWAIRRKNEEDWGEWVDLYEAPNRESQTETTPLPLTGVEILPYKAPHSRRLKDREGMKIRYWLGGQIINELRFIGNGDASDQYWGERFAYCQSKFASARGFNIQSQTNLFGGGAIIRYHGAFVDYLGNQNALGADYLYTSYNYFVSRDRIEYYDNRDQNGKYIGQNHPVYKWWTEARDRYDMPYQMYNVVPFYSDGKPVGLVREIVYQNEDYWQIPNDRFNREYPTLFTPNNGAYGNSKGQLAPVTLSGGQTVWVPSEVETDGSFTPTGIYTGTEELFKGDVNQIELKMGDYAPMNFFQPLKDMDGYGHVMWNRNKFTETRFTRYTDDHLAVYEFDKTVELLNNANLANNEFPHYYVKRPDIYGKEADIGWQTLAFSTVWDFGYTGFWLLSDVTFPFGNYDYDPHLPAISRSYKEFQNPESWEIAPRPGASVQRQTYDFSNGAMPDDDGAYNCKMEIGKMIQAYGDYPIDDPASIGKPGFYALTLRGAIPPIKCWGQYSARYYWDYRGDLEPGSGLRIRGVHTGAVVENGICRVYYQGLLISENVHISEYQSFRSYAPHARNFFMWDNEFGKMSHQEATLDGELWTMGTSMELTRDIACGENNLPTYYPFDLKFDEDFAKRNYRSQQGQISYMGFDRQGYGPQGYGDNYSVPHGYIPTPFGCVALHEWFTVLPEYQDADPYAVYGTRITNFKDGDRWVINTTELGTCPMYDDNPKRYNFASWDYTRAALSGFTPAEAKEHFGIDYSFDESKLPATTFMVNTVNTDVASESIYVPGKYNSQGRPTADASYHYRYLRDVFKYHEFGRSRFPMPGNCPWWPDTEEEITTEEGKTNYNVKATFNRLRPYVGKNGFYSFRSIGELPDYFIEGGFLLKNQWNRPVPPKFYEPEGFQRLPFGWNYSSCAAARNPCWSPDANNSHSKTRSVRYAYTKQEDPAPNSWGSPGEDIELFNAYQIKERVDQNIWKYMGGVDQYTRYVNYGQVNDGEYDENGVWIPDPNIQKYFTVTCQYDIWWNWFLDGTAEFSLEPKEGDVLYDVYDENADLYSNWLMLQAQYYSSGQLKNSYAYIEEGRDQYFEFGGIYGNIMNFTRCIGPAKWATHWDQTEIQCVEFVNSKAFKEEGPWERPLYWPTEGEAPTTMEELRSWEERDTWCRDQTPGLPYTIADLTPELGTEKLGDVQIKSKPFPQPLEVINEAWIDGFGFTKEDKPWPMPSHPKGIYDSDKLWSHPWHQPMNGAAELYSPGWTNDSRTPPMTGVWVQGTEIFQAGATGKEDRRTSDYVSVSFFLGGRLMWEKGIHQDDIGWASNITGNQWLVGSNYHPDLDALRKDYEAEYFADPNAGTPEADPNYFRAMPEWSFPFDNGNDLKRVMPSLYDPIALMSGAGRTYTTPGDYEPEEDDSEPPTVDNFIRGRRLRNGEAPPVLGWETASGSCFMFDWDATTPNFRDINHPPPNCPADFLEKLERDIDFSRPEVPVWRGRPFFEPYKCQMSPGIYRDNTPWFNGLAWSHEGGPQGDDYRWEVLGDPMRTAGRNGNYGLTLAGCLMPRNHWYEDAVEHYDMFGNPSDFAIFSGVIIRDGVMKMYYYGEEIYVGPMKVYRNQDIYRLPDPYNKPRQFVHLDRCYEEESRFEKIYVDLPGRGVRCFGVGRLVDVLPDVAGGFFGTHHLCVRKNGFIPQAEEDAYYPVNNRVVGSADMRTVWVEKGPAKNFQGYWTLHEYRTKPIMDGPKWDDDQEQLQIRWFMDNMKLWTAASTTGEDLDAAVPSPTVWQARTAAEARKITIHQNVNPRLIEKDFEQDCKECTPNPEDI